VSRNEKGICVRKFAQSTCWSLTVPCVRCIAGKWERKAGVSRSRVGGSLLDRKGKEKAHSTLPTSSTAVDC
jgi:hypothetical protein